MPSEVTQILTAISHGNRAQVDRLMELVYDDFQGLARHYFRREDPGHTLQPTALVHEAFLKLVDQRVVEWKGRAHFFAIGAQIMRRILVNHAKQKKRAKRGGPMGKISLEEELTISPTRDEDVLALDSVLAKLSRLNKQQATIVELRFFGGLDITEVAEVLQLSKRTTERNWTMVRAWLRRELAESEAGWIPSIKE